MTLTKEEAIRRHRMMWEWIGNETLRLHECVDKIDAFNHFGWLTDYVESWCWCCEYSNTIDTSGSCDHCPVAWPSKANRITCVHFGANEYKRNYGLFSIWCRALASKDWRTAAYYALYISMLPERK